MNIEFTRRKFNNKTLLVVLEVGRASKVQKYSDCQKALTRGLDNSLIFYIAQSVNDNSLIFYIAQSVNDRPEEYSKKTLELI